MTPVYRYGWCALKFIRYCFYNKSPELRCYPSYVAFASVCKGR
jgi:hypothetical protein